MFFGSLIFHELEINGEHVDDSENEDYSAARDDADEDSETAATAAEPEGNEDVDYTAQTPDDDDAEEDGGDADIADYTEDTPDEGNDAPEENADDDQEDTDYTAEEPPADNTDEPAGDDAGADEPDGGAEGGTEDYTQADMGGGDDADGAEEDNQDGNSDEGDGDQNTDAAPEEDNSEPGSLADMEKNLFSDLTPQQMAIKNTELLNNYVELYDVVNSVFDTINKIPKTYANSRSITFITDELVKLKDMVNYSITTTYVTRTYVENTAYYKQCLVMLNQINNMLKAVKTKCKDEGSI